MISSRTRTRFRLAAFAGPAVLFAAAAGCRPGTPPAAAPAPPPPAPSLAAARFATVEGLSSPRGVDHDTAQDVYFVSNFPGFISRIRPDGRVAALKFIEGGRGGTRLVAPRGVAVAGNLLWVADTDVLRAFDRNTGAPVRDVDAAPLDAGLLLGLAAGPDGSVYAADSGLRRGADGRLTHTGPDRVFRINLELGPGIAFRGAVLGSPGGIAWDRFRRVFLTVPQRGENVLAWSLGAREPEAVAPAVAGSNGVAVLDAGRFFVSSAEKSAVYLCENGQAIPLVTGISPPSGLGLDWRRRRLLIPIASQDRLEVWQLRETAASP